MRIGIVTTWFERGAAMVSRAYRDILATQHEVFIYARGGESYARQDPHWAGGAVTWGRRLPRGATPIDYAEFKSWAEDQGIELLIFNEQHDWTPVVLARRELKATLGAYVDYYRSDTVRFFELYDFLLCNTHRHYSVFAHHPHALYVPWGTDTQLFCGDGRRAAPDGVVFFHSAGMSPERKGTRVALQAFRMLRGPCQFVLHIQEPVSQWRAIADLCAADPRIQVIDRPVHAPGLYHRGDVYVYPTVLEGIGLTIAEALASGLPVITPDVPPMNEFVRHGENGRLVTPHEYRGRADGYYWAECHCRPESVAEAMQYYLDHRQQLETLKPQARASALARLNWRTNAADVPAALAAFESLYRERRDLSRLEREALRTAVLPPAKALARRTLARLGLLRRFQRLERWVCQ